MPNLLKLILCLSILSSCSDNKNQTITTLPEDTTAIEEANKAIDSHAVKEAFFEPGTDSVTIQPFEIEVTLSPKAAARLKKGKETIIVDVSFTGTPKDNVNAKLEEDGSFFVATTQQEITPGQVAKFSGLKFSKKLYDQLVDKNIDLAVNVFSGRKSSPDNLLSSDGLFDKISNVANKKMTIRCKLIAGDE